MVHDPCRTSRKVFQRCFLNAHAGIQNCIRKTLNTMGILCGLTINMDGCNNRTMLVSDLMNCHRIGKMNLPMDLSVLGHELVHFGPIGAMLVLRRHKYAMLEEHRVKVPVLMLVLRMGFLIVYVVSVVVIDCVSEGVV